MLQPLIAITGPGSPGTGHKGPCYTAHPQLTPGGSGWGANAHVPALRALPVFELEAVCTAHAGPAKASAEAFGADLALHDFEAMVSHPDIELIAVVVRVPGHNDLVMTALEAGKNAFCEWPLGADLAESVVETRELLTRDRPGRKHGRSAQCVAR